MGQQDFYQHLLSSLINLNIFPPARNIHHHSGVLVGDGVYLFPLLHPPPDLNLQPHINDWTPQGDLKTPI